MAVDKIKKLLNYKIGLNPDSVGDSSIERAINQRKNELRYDTVEQYYLFLLEDAPELYRLIEEVVVPETWFFRNNSPFSALKSHYVKHHKFKKQQRELRILSIPCSTGEEPYSIAIALMEVNPGFQRLHIDAVDISKNALAKAKRAIYSENSFRGDDANLKQQYFEKLSNGYRIDAKIKSLVNFTQGNFLVDPLCSEPEYYDIIFCRNLLIYFDKQTQKKAYQKLHRALRPGGLLFVGHAETSQVGRDLFEPTPYEQSFAFAKLDTAINAALSASVATKQATAKGARQSAKLTKDMHSPRSVPLAKGGGKPATTDKIAQSRVSKAKAKSQSGGALNAKFTVDDLNSEKSFRLSHIEQLADQGKITRAMDLCREFIHQEPANAHAYYLLGMMLEAQNNPGEAQSMLKKAVYLDPQHIPSLLQLKSIACKQGRLGDAEQFQRRISRINQRQNLTV